MFSSPKNQLFSTTKSLIEMQVDVTNKLGLKNLEGFSDLVNLNVHVMNAALNDSMEKMHALISSKNSLEFFTQMAAQAQPSASKFLSYGNEFAEIVSGMRDEFFKATQVEVSETGKEMTSMLEQLVEHESGSFKNMIHLTKATIKEAETEREQVVQAAENAIKPPRAAHTSHKEADQHHTAPRKKSSAAASKKANGHSRAAAASKKTNGHARKTAHH